MLGLKNLVQGIWLMPGFSDDTILPPISLCDYSECGERDNPFPPLRSRLISRGQVR